MKDLTPMEEAYKLLEGQPAIDAVSKAAKGEIPETDKEQRMRLQGKEIRTSIEEAYANLFESLSMIIRHR